MPCDICGKDTKVFLTEIEGAKLYVCSECNPSGQGRIAEQPDKEKSPFVKKQFVPKFVMRKEEPFDLNNYELAENYAEQIKTLRESRKKTIEEFAKDLFVPASYLQKVEQGKLKPSANLLLKLYAKYNLLLVNKKPEQEAKPFALKKEFVNRPKFEKEFEQKKKMNQVVANDDILKNSKVIYSSEAQKEQTYEPIAQNGKKKIILA